MARSVKPSERRKVLKHTDVQDGDELFMCWCETLTKGEKDKVMLVTIGSCFFSVIRKGALGRYFVKQRINHSDMISMTVDKDNDRKIEIRFSAVGFSFLISRKVVEQFIKSIVHFVGPHCATSVPTRLQGLLGEDNAASWGDEDASNVDVLIATFIEEGKRLGAVLDRDSIRSLRKTALGLARSSTDPMKTRIDKSYPPGMGKQSCVANDVNENDEQNQDNSDDPDPVDYQIEPVADRALILNDCFRMVLNSIQGPAALIPDIKALRAAMKASGECFDAIVAIDTPWLGDAGASALMESPILSHECGTQMLAIQLQNVNLTDKGILIGQIAVPALTSLLVLSLDHNPLENTGANEVSEAIKKLPSLRSLSVRNCKIGKTGTKVLIGTIQAHQIPLSSLDISFNVLGVRGSKALVAWLAEVTTLKQLSIAGTNSSLRMILECIAESAHLSNQMEALDIGWNYPYSNKRNETKSIESLVTLLSKSSSLEWLSMSGMALNHRKLRLLLEGAIDNDSMADESATRRLHWYLDHNALRGTKMPWGLLVECQPVVLDVSYSNLGGRGIIRLCNALQGNQSLSKLSLSGNLRAVSGSILAEVGDEIAAVLQNLSLTELEIAGVKSGTLRAGVLPILEAARNSQSLVYLDISGNACSPYNAAAKAVAQLLRDTSSLKSLRWDGNGTKITGLELVSAALLANTSLESLELPFVDGRQQSTKSRTKALQIVYWLNKMQQDMTARSIQLLKTHSETSDSPSDEQALQRATMESRGRGVSMLTETLRTEDRYRGDSVLLASTGDESEDEVEEEEFYPEADEDSDVDDSDEDNEDDGDEEDDGEDDESEDEDISQETLALRGTLVKESDLQARGNTPLTDAHLDDYSSKYAVADASSLAGWMMKKDPRTSKWRTRFFVLEGPLLCYYEDTNKTKLRGSVDMTQVKYFSLEPAVRGPSVNHEVFSFFAGVGGETARPSSSMLRMTKKKPRGRTWIFAAEIGAVPDWIGRLVRSRELAVNARKAELTLDEDQVGISGWLYKRNAGRQWKKRFFKQYGELFSYSLDATGVSTVGRIHISNIEEMRLSSKTRCPKGTKAFKIVCPDRVWVLAVPRAEGTPEQWLDAVKRFKPAVQLIDEANYLHAKKEKSAGKKLYKMLPYSIEIDSTCTLSESNVEVPDEEISSFRTASAALNPTHQQHLETTKGIPQKIGRNATIDAVFCTPCDPDATADTLPAGAIKGWCSWCFGCPGGIASGSDQEGNETWMVPRLQSPDTPNEDEDFGGLLAVEIEDSDEKQDLLDGIDLGKGIDTSSGVDDLDSAIEMLASIGRSFANPDRKSIPKDPLKRSEMFCTNCSNTVVQCARSDCDAFAKVTAYAVDCFCFKHLTEYKAEQDKKNTLPKGHTFGLKAQFIWYATLKALALLQIGHERDDFEDWQVSVPKSIRGFKGYCSWCFTEHCHGLSVVRAAGSTLFKCSGCELQTQKCTSAGCTNFARASEHKCAYCTNKAQEAQAEWWPSSAGQASKESQNLERYCSWCFEKAEHVPFGFDVDDGRIQYVCSNCDLKTVPCQQSFGKSCTYAMANGAMYVGEGPCAYHALSAPAEPQYIYFARHGNRVAKITEKQDGRSLLQELNNDRESYTLPPNLKAMDIAYVEANGASLRKDFLSVSSATKSSAKPTDATDDTEFEEGGDKDTAVDDALAATSEGIDAVNAKVKSFLPSILTRKPKQKQEDDDEDEEEEEEEEDDEEDPVIDLEEEDDDDMFDFPSWEQNESIRKKAWNAGLMRPFLCLLSMTHKERLRVAAMTGVRLAEQPYFGDAHAESYTILLKRGWGLQDRTTEYNEKLNPADTKVNWYEMLYRVTDHIFDEGVRTVPRESSMGGFSSFGDSFKPTIGANSLYACVDSDDDRLLQQLEHTFVAKVEAAQAQGRIHSGPVVEFKYVKEGDCSFGDVRWQKQAFALMEHAVEGEGGKRTGPSKEELLSRALMDLPGMTEEKLQEKLEEEGLEAVQALKAEVEEKLKAKAEEAVQNMLAEKANTHLKKYAWKKIDGYLDTLLAPVGIHGIKQGWFIAKLLAKVANIAMQIKFGSSLDFCAPALFAIVKQQQFLHDTLKQQSTMLRSLYSSTLLHCINCQRNEVAKNPPPAEPGASTGEWPTVKNGSRWMFYKNQGVMSSSWEFKHVVVEDGTVALHKNTLHKSKKAALHFPVTPATTVLTAEDKLKEDAEKAEQEAKRQEAQSGVVKAGKAVAQMAVKEGVKQWKGGQAAKQLALLAALASVPKPEVIAICSCCGFASPFRSCNSAGELLRNAEEGDRRTLLVPPDDDSNPVRLNLSMHTIHVQRTDSNEARTDLYTRQGSSTAVIRDEANNVELVPVRPVDTQPLLDAIRSATQHAEQYLEDAKSDEAKLQRKAEYKPRSFDIACHDKELRSNGWNYVLKVAALADLDDPYWVKSKYRGLRQLRKQLEFHFPYIMPTLKHPFPPKKKKGTPTPILLAQRVRMFDAWLKEVCLKKALFESSELRTFLIRDNSIQFVSAEDYRTSENLSGARRTSLLSLDDPESTASEFSVSIVGTQEQRARGGNFLLFILEVRQHGEVWRLAHRYNDFFKLSNELRRAFPEKSTIRLPENTYTMKQTGRMSLSPVNRIDQQLIAERKQILWSFIADCILQPVIVESDQFQQFIRPVTTGLRDKVTRRLSIVNTTESNAGVKELKGELFKKGVKGTKAWRKRLFVLDPIGQKMSYYAGVKQGADDSGDLHGEIHLRSVTKVKALDEAEGKALKLKSSLFGFLLDEPDRTWYLAAEQEPSRAEWIENIQALQSASQGDLTRAGYVKKQSTVLKRWNQRYLVCDPITQTIMLFKQRGSEIRADLYLKDVIVCEELPPVLFPNVPNTFKVATSTVTWNFSCAQKVDMELWVTTIQGYMKGTLERHNSLVAPERKLSRSRMLARKLSGRKASTRPPEEQSKDAMPERAEGGQNDKSLEEQSKDAMPERAEGGQNDKSLEEQSKDAMPEMPERAEGGQNVKDSTDVSQEVEIEGADDRATDATKHPQLPDQDQIDAKQSKGDQQLSDPDLPTGQVEDGEEVEQETETEKELAQDAEEPNEAPSELASTNRSSPDLADGSFSTVTQEALPELPPATVPDSAAAPLAKSGYLVLEIQNGKSVTKAATKKWIVLDSGKLSHFVSEEKQHQSPKAKTKRMSMANAKVGVMQMTAETKLGAFQSNKAGAQAIPLFSVMEGKASWKFQAGSITEMQEWLGALKANRDRLREDHNVGLMPQKSTRTDTSRQSGSNAGNDNKTGGREGGPTALPVEGSTEQVMTKAQKSAAKKAVKQKRKEDKQRSAKQAKEEKQAAAQKKKADKAAKKKK